jgi:hypothetical protein
MKKVFLFSVTVLLCSYGICVFAQGIDFGDAKDPGYATLTANNGAGHQIVPGMCMGIYIDAEPNGQPSGNAQGDDMNGIDDADGVNFTSWIVAGQNASVVITVSNNGQQGFLNAWIDFNCDSDWVDAGEQIFTNTVVTAGKNNLTFNVPASIAVGFTYVRFRYSSVQGLPPTGIAVDGEVEDYFVQLGGPPTGATYIDPDPTMTFTQNEISMALIPGPNFGLPSLIVAAYNDEPFPGCPGMGVSYTTNAGNTWTNKQLALPVNPVTGAVYLDAFDPSVCIDDSGHVFVSQICTDYNWTAGPASGLFVHKSTDGCVTWQTPVAVSTNGNAVANPDSSYRFNDRDQIIADNYSMSPGHRNIYIAWIKDRGWNMTVPASDIWFSRSTNGGLTFSAPLQVNSMANNLANMPIPVVAKNGTVYLSWLHYNVRTGGKGVIFLDKSTDGGVTFGNDIYVDSIDLPPINLNNYTDARAKGAPVLKVMPSDPNELYIVYAEDPDGAGPDEADIFLIKSTNGGTSWSTRKRVNDDNGTSDQVLPWMVIKPNGTIDIAWYDRRKQPGDLLWDVYFTTSVDGGTTFATNQCISGTSFITPNPAKSPDKWMGEYPGLAADYQKAYIAWTTSIPDINGDVVFASVNNPQTGLDWGDASDPTYPTLAINNGARHANDGATWMGTFCDTEPDGIPNAMATGDDTFNAVDDEDGVIFPGPLKKGRTDTLKVTVTANGYVNGWFDFNTDGDWADAGEHALANVPVTTGLNNLLLTVPWGAGADTTYARFRFATYSGLGYTGPATDGEVEDYRFVILDSVPPNLAVQGVTVVQGEQVCYNASDTLRLAGPSPVQLNTSVIIQNGGQATFIAGQVIMIRYGFRAHAGSHVDAHITSDSTFCGSFAASGGSRPVSQAGLAPPVSARPASGPETTVPAETTDLGHPGFRLYPNPTSGSFIAVIPETIVSGTIRVMSMLGTMTEPVSLNNRRIVELDISHLPPGLYLVILQTENEIVTGRVVLK